MTSKYCENISLQASLDLNFTFETTRINRSLVQGLHSVVLLPFLTGKTSIEQTDLACTAGDSLRIFFTHSLADQHTIMFFVQILLQDGAILGIQAFRGARCVAHELDTFLQTSSCGNLVLLSASAKAVQEHTYERGVPVIG